MRGQRRRIAALKCSFIIPGYKCDEFIFRNIESILDQDYENYEIIPVLNGQWETKSSLASAIREKYGNKVNCIEIDEPGLGNANNYGFSKSNGDIISHLSSDLYLMPGTLRTWVDAFKENPNKGIVYSGYRFVSPDPSQVYYSNGFDRYHLECENFIDGANPVRRNNWKPFSTSLKSLIDWDWVLSVTDDGAQAYYIGEPLYFAELPKEGGLSYDSSLNWVQRRKEIRSKHNIPDRKICITSMVDPGYALEIAKMLDCDYRTNPGHKPHEYDLIYSYGFNCRTQDKELEISTSVFFQHRKHKIIHWRTEDIRTLIQERWIDVRRIAEELAPHIKNHFCSTEYDRQKLFQIGINADLIYPPSVLKRNIERTSGISVNDIAIKDQLDKAMPDKQFYVNDLSCPMTIHYEDRHDRIYQSIANGNIVISNVPVHGASQIMGYTNVPELRKMLVHEIRRIDANGFEINQEIVEKTRAKISPKRYKSMLEKIAHKQISKYGKLESVANA